MATSTLSKPDSFGVRAWVGSELGRVQGVETLRPATPSPAPAPNPVIQLIAALRISGLGAVANHALVAVGERDWTWHPPREPVDERRIAGVHRALRYALPSTLAPAVLARAGRLTAEDLLNKRIPAWVRRLLPRLPGALAVRLAGPVIAAHAATFAGSGALRIRAGAPTVIEITDNPFCAGEHASAPVCAWQAAAFQRLFEGLLGRPARVVETDCHAAGDECCRFEIVWGEMERRQRLSRRLGPAASTWACEPVAPARRSSTWACIDGRMTQIPGAAALFHGPWG